MKAKDKHMHTHRKTHTQTHRNIYTVANRSFIFLPCFNLHYVCNLVWGEGASAGAGLFQCLSFFDMDCFL